MEFREGAQSACWINKKSYSRILIKNLNLIRTYLRKYIWEIEAAVH